MNTNITPERERERDENRKEVWKTDNRESKIAYHKKKFIIYLVLWIFSGIITGIISALGGLAGASMGGVEGAIGGALIFMLIGVIVSLAFLVLWIYHLVKWIGVKKE